MYCCWLSTLISSASSELTNFELPFSNTLATYLLSHSTNQWNWAVHMYCHRCFIVFASAHVEIAGLFAMFDLFYQAGAIVSALEEQSNNLFLKKDNTVRCPTQGFPQGLSGIVYFFKRWVSSVYNCMKALRMSSAVHGIETSFQFTPVKAVLETSDVSRNSR